MSEGQKQMSIVINTFDKTNRDKNKIYVENNLWSVARTFPDLVVTGMLIVCAPTGVVCSLQAGGAICDHPGVEGYYMTIYTKKYETGETDPFIEAYNEVGDCAWGCNINLRGYEDCDREAEKDNIKHNKNEFAKDIDKFLKNESIIYYWGYDQPVRFIFDYERVDEVMEGLWPVLIQLQNDHIYMKNPEWSDKRLKGYLHFGNCD